jgi:homoserine kinase
LLPALQELAGRPRILGAVLSGAGPSVLMFLEPRGKTSTKKITTQVAVHLQQKNLVAELLVTAIAERGATGAYKARR